MENWFSGWRCFSNNRPRVVEQLLLIKQWYLWRINGQKFCNDERTDKTLLAQWTRSSPVALWWFMRAACWWNRRLTDELHAFSRIIFQHLETIPKIFGRRITLVLIGFCRAKLCCWIGWSSSTNIDGATSKSYTCKLMECLALFLHLR